MRKRLLVSLAFATWCFLTTWVELAEGRNAYYARFDPRVTVALPVLLCMALLALVMLAAWTFLTRFRHSRLPHLLFLVCCLVPLGVTGVALLRVAPVNLIPLVRNRFFWPVALMAGLGPAAFALLRPHRASLLMRRILYYSWPVLAVVLVHAVRGGLLAQGSAFADGQPAARLANTPRVRVVWIVFDELSRKFAFDSRPASLRLPHLDRLRAESFYGSAAKSPAGFTLASMPSLILGETVTEAIEDGPAALRMKSDLHPQPFGWNNRTNVFDTARAMGYNTALAGWFHPYGRALNRSLTEFYWVPCWLNPGIEEQGESHSLLSDMGFRIQMQLAALPLVGHYPGLFPGLEARLEKIERFGRLMQHAEQASSDPSLGLVLLHLTEPHPPPVYSRQQQALAPGGKNSYLDSLAYTDLILAGLRRAMERRCVWETTAVILSSDHGWRGAIWRGTPEWTAEDEALPGEDTFNVPFMVKMPHQHAAVVYSKPFNAVVTRAVITEILAGRLTSPEQLPAILERGAAPLRSPGPSGS
jgi:hypothetical protein